MVSSSIIERTDLALKETRRTRKEGREEDAMNKPTAMLACLLVPALAPRARAEDLMRGKVKTDQTIRLEKTVDVPPDRAFEMWATEAGVRSFFAPAARIDPREGGRYEILFAPDKDPEGLSHGTTGARLLKYQPGRSLSFEWITFAGDANLGVGAPPVVPREVRNEVPLPTWVELDFRPVDGHPGATDVRFAHYGFRTGGRWEESFAWFSKAWAGVLESMAATSRGSNNH
jgi:uncharacterized protein YndB with AHSA1/START domain